MTELLLDALGDWLWQGCAVAIAATVALRGSRRLSATTRYQLWWVALAAVLAIPAVPWALALAARLQPVEVATTAVVAETPVAGLEAPGIIVPALPAWLSAPIAIAWGIFGGVCAFRIIAALRALRRVKRAARPFPIARERRLRHWMALRARGRRAALAISDDVRAAAVLGPASPLIVVAPHALEALEDHELDQIVVHEWAHVQRRDDLARLAQLAITAVVGLHPAVWWINRQLNLERETACDDWAIRAAGSSKRLAVSLTKLAASPARQVQSLPVPAAFLQSELTIRVERLLDPRRNTSTKWTSRTSVFVAPPIAALALAVGSVDLVVAAGDSRVAHATLAPVPVVSLSVSSSAVAAAPVAALAYERRGRSATSRVGRARQATVVPPTPNQPAPRLETPPDPPRVAPLAGPDVRLGAEHLPGSTTPIAAADLPAPANAVDPPATGAPTPWGSAADAGVTVGRGSQKAAVATAGFFSRMGKSMARVF